MLDPQTFLELTEAALLKDIGERLRSFFDEYQETYVHQDHTDEFYTAVNGEDFEQIHGGLYKLRREKNPRSAIQPMAQINMVANVTFHLMAQQLALLFASRPGINKKEVYDTVLANVKKLVAQYTEAMKEEANEQADGKGSSDRSESHGGLSDSEPAERSDQPR